MITDTHAPCVNVGLCDSLCRPTATRYTGQHPMVYPATELSTPEVRYLKAYMRFRLGARDHEPKIPNDSYIGVTPDRAAEIRALATAIFDGTRIDHSV